MSNYSPFQALIDRQAEVWRRNQEAYLAAWEATVSSWLKRSQESLAAASETAQAATRCNDLAALAELQQKWIAGALARLTEDMTAPAENAMALSQHSFSSVSALAEEMKDAPELDKLAWAIAPNPAKPPADEAAPHAAAKPVGRRPAQPAGTGRQGVGQAGT